MKTLAHISIGVALASIALVSGVASAQITGSGGGEGYGSSGHEKTLGINPQNIGYDTNTAAAGSAGMSYALIAFTIGLACGGVAYLSLNKAFARA